MKTVIAAVAALSAPSVASAQAVTDVVVMRRAVAPPRAAAQPAAPPTKAKCSLTSPAVVYQINGQLISYSEKKTPGWTGSLAQLTAATKTFCEDYQGATACEGFIDGNAALRIIAYKATGPVVQSGAVVTQEGNYGRGMPVAGYCTPN
jgi:hypothetical protein